MQTRDSALGTYSPQRFIIRIGPDIQLCDAAGSFVGFATAHQFAIFWHEYCHYLQNTSTVFGLYSFGAFLNCWKLFSGTGANGRSRGSTCLDADQRRTAGAWLETVRMMASVGSGPPQGISRVEGLTIRAVIARERGAGKGAVELSELACDAEISRRDGSRESAAITVGVHEIEEGVANLVEHSVLRAVDPGAPALAAPVFPYGLLSAVARYYVPDLSDREVAQLGYLALQSLNPPAELARLLLALAYVEDFSSTRSQVIESEIERAAVSIEVALREEIVKLEAWWSGKSILEVGLRQLVSIFKQGLSRRREDPFFELSVAEKGSTNVNEIGNALLELVPCPILQIRPGSNDEVSRDVLLSFKAREFTDPVVGTLDADSEDPLRVIHAAFELMMAHIRGNRYITTKRASDRICPFYTTCDLDMRLREPNRCRSRPWTAATWKGWDAKGLCWYGAAVRQTMGPSRG